MRTEAENEVKTIICHIRNHKQCTRYKMQQDEHKHTYISSRSYNRIFSIEHEHIFYIMHILCVHFSAHSNMYATLEPLEIQQKSTIIRMRTLNMETKRQAPNESELCSNLIPVSVPDYFMLLARDFLSQF